MGREKTERRLSITSARLNVCPTTDRVPDLPNHYSSDMCPPRLHFFVVSVAQMER